MEAADNDIDQIRAFNRFHTRLVGVLNEGLLASEFPLIQVRVLYELAHSSDLAAADLVERLGVDPGYLSRMISALDRRDLISKVPDRQNGKRILLSLSPEGKKVFDGLNAASAKEVGDLIAPLSDEERGQLVGSMRKIRRLLGDASETRTWRLREPRPGDMGWIVHRHGVIYAAEYQLDWTFEALVGRIVGDFVTNLDPQSEHCWIAEMEDEVVGSVFVVRQDATTAKLRLLYVEAAARGLGVGRALVDEVISFSRERGYKRLELWTNSVLVSAIRIYQAAGFELVEETPHHSFGQDLVGQTWALDL
jgi:DNA-binding MarR family transcriptional regulator/GNAT superfamily N-acetyltransferase